MSTPWITDGKPQQSSTSPDVTDLYKSSGVFINEVNVVLYGEASGSAASASVPAAQSAIDPAAADEFAASSIPAPADEIANGGPVSSSDSSSPLTNTPGAVDLSATGGDLIPWLEARVKEAASGAWSRVNPAHGAITSTPGNVNIANIWKSLGMSGNALFKTDQPAWCMGFVNFALKSCGYKWCPEASSQAISTNPGRWSATPIPINQGQPGDIVYWNFHHVNFIYQVKGPGNYTFIGGNQGGSVGNNNPGHSAVTVSWPSGLSASGKGQISGIFRPHKGA